MSSGKFIPALMQKTSAQTQKIRQEQYKSTYKYFQYKNTKNPIQDLFVKKEEPSTILKGTSVMDILTGKTISNKK